MTLSVETIRKEIRERQESVLALRREQDDLRATVERLEAEVAERRARVGEVESAVAHETQTIDALEHAASLLAERLPVPPSDPVRVSRERAIERARERREDEIASARRRTEPAPEPSEKPRRRSPTSTADPLTVRTHRGGYERTNHGPKAAQSTVEERAAELDLGAETRTWLDRADLAALVLVEEGGMTGITLAETLAPLLSCTRRTASPIVSRVLPILFRQGRITRRTGDEDAVVGVVWEATPAEKASASIGTDVDSYAGTTTRWPTEGTAPKRGTRIQVASGPFEQGKGR